MVSPAPPTIDRGPILGEFRSTSVRVWARLSGEMACDLHVESDAGRAFVGRAEASAEQDFTVRWHVTGLVPDTAYRYSLHLSADGSIEPVGATFRTPLADDRVTRIACGSCANDLRFPEQPVWDAVAEAEPDLLVLLGDSPYVDSTELAVQRARRRAFWGMPNLAQLVARVPVAQTWDDHDFGKNDYDGRLEGKERSRQAFCEWTVNPSYGDGTEGIYTSVRSGPVEVFLIDARTFARVGPSPVTHEMSPTTLDDEAPRTVLGPAQWTWLKDALKRSDAPFKVLATGMIWNGATRPLKYDHWANYRAERDALFAWLGRERIEGVVLLSGDIHRSRAIRHATEGAVGYDLLEVITSPLANTIIEAANAPHPGLLWDGDAPRTFALLEADARAEPATLTVRWLDDTGAELHREVRTRDTLARSQ